MDADLKAEMSRLKVSIIRWNVGTMIAMTVIDIGIVVAFKLFE